MNTNVGDFKPHADGLCSALNCGFFSVFLFIYFFLCVVYVLFDYIDAKT